MKTDKYEIEVLDSNKNESYHLIPAKDIAEARFIARNLHILQFKYISQRLPIITSTVISISEVKNG